MPASPGAAYKPVVTARFAISGDVETFDQSSFRSSLLSLFPAAEDVVLVVSAASVSVTARLVMSSATDADSTTTSLTSLTPTQLSSSLNTTIAEAPTASVAIEFTPAPSPPYQPPSPASPPIMPGAQRISGASALRGALSSSGSIFVEPGVITLSGEGELTIPAGVSVSILGSHTDSGRRLTEGESTLLDGGSSSRIFNVYGHLRLEGVELAHGLAQYGGAIFVHAGAELELVRVIVRDSSAEAGETFFGSAYGGGLFVSAGGRASVSTSTFHSCNAKNTLVGGQAEGGCMYSLGQASIATTIMHGCSAVASASGRHAGEFMCAGTLFSSRLYKCMRVGSRFI